MIVDIALSVADVPVTPSDKVRVVWGDTVEFTATADGTPDSVTLDLKQGDEAEEVLLVQQSGGIWSYVLDTADWCRGMLYWSLRVEGTFARVVRDGYLNIIANRATSI